MTKYDERTYSKYIQSSFSFFFYSMDSVEQYSIYMSQTNKDYFLTGASMELLWSLNLHTVRTGKHNFISDPCTAYNQHKHIHTCRLSTPRMQI